MIGRDEHLPLWLTGNGIGPKGMLSYDVLDIGDVFATSSSTITLYNTADIAMRYSLSAPQDGTFVK